MTARELSAARAVDRRNQAETTEAPVDVVVPEGEPREIEIRLADLIGDENSETVLYNDSSARALRVVADCPVIAEGRVERHVTAGGANVSGFHYMRFASGLTIYFEEGLSLVVHAADRATSP